MYRLLVLITIISGVSTRGVPAADDKIGEHVEPKHTETDKTDRSSEHVTLEECEDCPKESGYNGAEISTSPDKKGDKADVPKVLSNTPKPSKPFLAFHRIKVKVNKESRADRKSRRKERRRHNHRSKVDVSSQAQKRISAEAGDEQAPSIKQLSTTRKSKQKDAKSEQIEKEDTDKRVATELDKGKPNEVLELKLQDAKTPPEETTKYLKEDKILSDNKYHKKNSRNYEGQRQINEDKQDLNNKLTVNRQTQEQKLIEDKSVAIDTHTSTGNKNENSGIKLNKGTGEKNVHPIESKDKKDSFEEELKKPKDRENTADQPLEKQKDNQHSDFQVLENIKDKTDSVEKETGSINQVIGKSKDDTKSVDQILKKHKDKTDYDDQVVLKPNEEKGSIDQIVGARKHRTNSGNLGLEKHESVEKPTDNTDSIGKVHRTPKDKKDSIDQVLGKPKGRKQSIDQVLEKPKDKKESVDHVIAIPKDKKESVDQEVVEPKDEKGSVDHIIPKNVGDRWSREGLSQVPDVERLERRLHPTVDAPVKDIIQSMKNMLKLIQSSLHTVDDDYKMIHNTTRWKYMVGVREQLSELATENDKIYDVVMEASLLTKEIYRKAHERREPRVNVEAMAVSYRSRLNTDMHTQMHTNFFAAQKELEQANQLLEQIKASQRQKDSLSDEKIRLYHIVRDRLPLRSMHDLYRRADQTINILTSAQPLSRYGDKTRLYGHMRNDTTLNMKRSRELIVEGFDLLEHAKRVLMENKQKAERHGHMIRSTLPAGTAADMPFDSSRMELFVAWDKANHYASSLSDKAAEIHMKFAPLLDKAKEVMASRDGVGFQKILERSAKKLKETVKSFLDVLDQIRMIFGDDRIMTDRCEVLQGAKYFPESPISCDKYITLPEILESSGDGVDGSGDEDDTTVDMEATNISTPNVTKEESSTDINITEKHATEGVNNKNQTIPPQTFSIDEIDDEDRAQEIKLKLVSKPSPTTKATQTTTPTPTTTASTDDTDDDMFFDPFGWFQDEPDDDPIIIDSNEDTWLSSVSENKTLNELIRERLYNYSRGSKELLEAAEISKTKMNDISLTWQKVKKRFDTLRNNTLNAISVVSKWKAEKAYFSAVHDHIGSVKEDLNFRKEIVEQQCSDAVDMANKKLQDMTEVYEKQSEKSKNSADPTEVQDAVSQVKIAVDNVNEINRLKQLYPTPCDTLQRLDKRIRTNITELRKKIERAKLIASSLQIAVAVPKEEYLEFPITEGPQENDPLTSQVQVMLKHTGSNGRLVSVHAGESESLALEVKDDAITVVQSIDGDEKSLSLYEDSIEDKWYLVLLQRFAAGYNLTMFGNKGVLGKVGTVTSAEDYRPLTPELLPTTLRLGASGDLTACALGLEINGRSIDILDMGNNESTATPCSTQGRWTSHQSHLMLDGSGYALVSLNDLPSIRTLLSLKVSFNPKSDGTIVFLQPKRMATVVDIYVQKGFLVVYVFHRNFETKLKSTIQVYSTDNVLDIVFKDGRTKGADVVLNGRSNVFTTAKGRKRDMETNSHTIFIGGIPMENSSMVGCLKAIEINGEAIPFHNLYEAEGQSFGTCTKTECVRFDDNSIPVEFENLTSVQSLHISVKRGSLGPVLTFSKHKEKFNLVVSLNTEGLTVEETIQEDTEDFSVDGDSEFIVVAIQDDTKSESLMVSVGDSSETFSYKSGGGWPWGNGDKRKDNGPVSYSISLGNSTDDTPPFIGTIQNFMLDGRPVDLLKFVQSNQLGRCTLDPAPSIQKQEKHETKGITCQKMRV